MPKKTKVKPILETNDQAYCIAPGVFKAIVGGKVIAADFPDMGSAKAAIPVERARMIRKQAKSLKSKR